MNLTRLAGNGPLKRQLELEAARHGLSHAYILSGPAGSGRRTLAGLLAGQGVDTLVCGGIGGGARTALAQAGIQLYPGVSGLADAAVDALLAGTLAYNPDTVCAHHEGHGHEEGHDCGHHGHSCGGHCGH